MLLEREDDSDRNWAHHECMTNACVANLQKIHKLCTGRWSVGIAHENMFILDIQFHIAKSNIVWAEKVKSNHVQHYQTLVRLMYREIKSFSFSQIS